MGKEHLIIRADASPRIGSGHLMRTIALAQAWRDDSGEVTFVISEETRPFIERLKKEGFDMAFVSSVPGSADDARQTASLAKAKGSEWLVIDGYHFTEAYRSTFLGTGLKILWIDDCGSLRGYFADIILNQNIYATVADYPDALPSTKLLLGTKYLLLRKDFMTGRGGDRDPSSPPRSLLVTMGGSDPDNVSADVLEALEPFVEEFPLQISAVLGIMNPHFDDLKKRFKDSAAIILMHDVGDMPSLIRRTDIVITGAGTTSGEIAFLGIPMITVILSENQKRVAQALHNAGAALCIRDRNEVKKVLPGMLRLLFTSPETRKKMALNATNLVDGEGVSRVIMHMKQREIRLRRVSDSDCRLLWEWANDPNVRRNAFDQQPIDLDSHKNWFSEKQKSPDCYHYIAIDTCDIPVGQIRFDRTGDMAEVDISVDKKYRGRGLGQALLRQGIVQVFSDSSCKAVHAYVKTVNGPSAGLFLHAGFTCIGKTAYKESEVYEFMYSKIPARGGRS